MALSQDLWRHAPRMGFIARSSSQCLIRNRCETRAVVVEQNCSSTNLAVHEDLKRLNQVVVILEPQVTFKYLLLLSCIDLLFHVTPLHHAIRTHLTSDTPELAYWNCVIRRRIAAIASMGTTTSCSKGNP